MRGRTWDMQKKIVQRLARLQDLPCICMYCGEPASDREHVYPRSKFGERGIKVWACRECNLIASDKVFLDIEEKGEYIRSELRKKYMGLYKYPDWDDDELATLGYSMRKRVQSMLEQKRWIRKRLLWQSNPNVLIVLKFLQENDIGNVSALTRAEMQAIRPSDLSLLMSIESETQTP